MEVPKLCVRCCRVGWLAVALGSGDIVVAAVPHPAAVAQSVQDPQRRRPQQRQHQDEKQEAPLAVRLSSSVGDFVCVVARCLPPEC